MNSETLSLEIRQFLKKVGITSHREIEQSIQAALESGQITDNATLSIKMHLTIPELDMHHHVNSQLHLE
ncbi:hypothetical protein Q7C_2 [Methylophaga frappieri]|uniref:Uncharacterized protein n=1 Tax=Methylophaga frappieri (strain ATCC BAA-2434 / DSM 25690 / JAM7) TaxID=754477 RepID=I1YE44_METFJ|nr:DUF6494 family protein [Methylophaga frappieri]AFJ01187.1 hypothetical protein Q7C_2 [Methylophaga frappieri]